MKQFTFLHSSVIAIIICFACFLNIAHIKAAAGDTIKVEAEVMTLSGSYTLYTITGASGNASDNTVRGTSGSNWAEATYTFSGTSGTYDIAVQIYDVASGDPAEPAPYQLLVNTDTIASWNNDTANASDVFVLMSFTDVAIDSGDIITIRSKKDGSSIDRGYMDYLKLTEKGTSPGGVIETSVQSSQLQVFPNPVKDNASVSFTLSEASQVNIDLLNILGQKVTTIAQHSYNAGQHEVSFDASQLQSGQYFVRMTHGSIVFVTKCVVIE